MKIERVHELIYQSLEHEMGGVKVYETAVQCAINTDMKEEWEKYLEQTRTHVQRLHDVCDAFSLDPTLETPGRAVVRGVGAALVDAMRNALAAGPDAAQLVACEAVSLAETKDHLDWELLGKCAENLPGLSGAALRSAVAKVEEEEDEHLYHTKGWCRELWLQSLGFKAVLPPPEEKQHVKTAVDAANVDKARQNQSRQSRR